MALLQIISKGLRLHYRDQNSRKWFDPKSPTTLVARFSVDSKPTTEAKREEIFQKKVLKVGLIGRPNAGKSTLINRIVNMNICDVSRKTHTTRFPLRTAFFREDTQILFVDTPGLVTKGEVKKFKLERPFSTWKTNVFNEIDVLAFIYDSLACKGSRQFHANLNENLRGVSESVPVLLIFNKIDLIEDKSELREMVAELAKTVVSEEDSTSKKRRTFLKTFLISALRNEGVDELLNYLIERARPGDWVLKRREVCDAPIHALVANLIRAKMLDKLKHEIPYRCEYEVEYLEENDLGELVCVALVTCATPAHRSVILRQRGLLLKTATRELESDLYKIVGKTFRLRLVVTTKPRKAENDIGMKEAVWSSAEKDQSRFLKSGS